MYTCDDNGDTALHLASRAGFAEVVALLVRMGANINRTNSTNRTALHDAKDEATKHALLRTRPSKDTSALMFD